jgi:hypothetical protein
MDKSTFISFLKLFTIRNKINIRIDDITEVIEVVDESFNDKLLIEQLRQSYKNVK